jgi:hypothetical protein
MAATRRRTSRAPPRGGSAASQVPASSPKTLPLPIRSTRNATERLQPLPQHLGREPGPRLGARAGIGDLAFGQPALLAEDVDLERRRPRMAAHASRRTRSGPSSMTRRFAQVGDDVGREVGARDRAPRRAAAR